ncbi:MAG: hypothetical protein PHN84_09390 [Desulfuromonadaceae bacterium]|nr:hypothetical protein [Desulfuromonadaceae bacterium]MDD2854081.1 hypothetical protein [Desulfuromonadaceae bacterium]
MNNLARHFISCLSVLCFLSALLLSGGCAASSTTIIEEEIVANPKPMYNYKSLIIKDFELKREMFTDAEESGMSGREIAYAKIPAELSDQIERYVKLNGTFAKVSRAGKSDASTLLLTGKFTRVGRFKISVQVILIDGETGANVASFSQTLWDVMDTTVSVGEMGREVADFLYRIQYK